MEGEGDVEGGGGEEMGMGWEVEGGREKRGEKREKIRNAVGNGSSSQFACGENNHFDLI